MIFQSHIFLILFYILHTLKVICLMLWK